MRSVKVLGLDLDGTLVKLKLDFRNIRSELGIPEGDTLAYISSLPSKEATRLKELLVSREKAAAEDAEISPGGADLIEHCRSRGIKVVVITRNSNEASARTLEVLGIEVDMIVSREMADPKPSPEALNFVLGQYNIKPHEMVFVGDYLYDMQAGRAAGVKTVLISPSDSRGEWGSSADHIASDLYEVLDLIREGRKIGG